MNHKVRIVFTVILFLSVLSLSALDFGGSIENLSALEIESGTSFQQGDKISLWLDSSIGKSLYAGAQGSYTFTLTRPYLFDLELLKLKGEYPIGDDVSFLSFEAGRFPVQDFSGNVLSHPLDGLKIHMKLAPFNATVYTGFSGLLFKESSLIMMSKHDAADRLDAGRLLAPPRLVGMAELEFIELLRRINVTTSYIMQIDLRSADTLGDQIRGGRINTHYIGLGAGGAAPFSLYWNIHGYLGFGSTLSLIDGAYSKASIRSFLGGISARWYPEKKLYSRILFKMLYASGDADNYTFIEGNTAGRSSLFIPVAETPLETMFTPQLGNIVITDIRYSLKPLAPLGKRGEQFQTEIKSVFFFRPTTGAISEPYNSASDAKYVGTEIDLALNFRPVSDLGLSLVTGMFFPNTKAGGVFLSTQRGTETAIKLNAVLSF